MSLIIISYMKAQDTYSIYSNEAEEIISYIKHHPFESFEFTKHGLQISCIVEYEGYFDYEIYNNLVPEYGHNIYTFTFSIKKV